MEPFDWLSGEKRYSRLAMFIFESGFMHCTILNLTICGLEKVPLRTAYKILTLWGVVLGTSAVFGKFLVTSHKNLYLIVRPPVASY